MRHSNL